MSIGTAPYPMFPQLPPKEERTTYPGVEIKTLSPEQKQNEVEQRAVEQEMVNATERETEHKLKIADVESTLEKERADEMGRQMEARAKVEDLAAKDVDSWKTSLNEAYTAAIRAPAPSLFRGGASTAENVFRAFNLMMIGIGDAGTNAIAVQQGRAPTSRQLHEFIAADLASQRQNIEQLKDNVVMTRTGLRDAQEAREQMLAQVDARGAAVYKRLEALAKARLSAAKKPQIEIDGDKRVQELALEGVKLRAQSVSGLTRKWEAPTKEIINREASPAATRPTESQNTLALIGQAIKDDLAVVESSKPVPADVLAKFQQQSLDMEAATKSSTDGILGNAIVRLGRAVDFVPKSATEGIPAEHQKSLTAYTRMTRQMIKQITGAGMSLPEATALTNIYAPQPGDSKAMIAEKLAAFEAESTRMLALAGAAGPIAQANPRRTSTSAPASAASGIPANAPAGKPVPAEDLNSEAPLEEDPKAQSIDELQKPVAPAVAAPKTAAPVVSPAQPAGDPRRAKLIELIRKNPTDKRLRIAAKNYNITEDEIRGN